MRIKIIYSAPFKAVNYILSLILCFYDSGSASLTLTRKIRIHVVKHLEPINNSVKTGIS